MKNVTITVEDEALEWARIEAAKRNTSVSRLVGELLSEMRRQNDAYARAHQSWLHEMRRWQSNGQPYASRDSLHERGEGRRP